MDDARGPEDPATPEVYTVGYLEPIRGRHIEMDYTGQVIAGRYHIAQHIGSGGMADVYRAHDERLRCDVAVKFLKPRLASEEWCARMFQEARASAAIDHPHILRITDVGRVGPSIYLAMDLLSGASLETVLRGSPGQRLPWRRALELFLPVLGAFQAAHDVGFIHRDIKPDNLFLRVRGAEQRIIVLDLGIVKHMPAEPQAAALPATATGYVLGTPAYMSPEQASGVPLGPGTDIYSLGMTLYRALSGRLPFVGVPGEPGVVLSKHLYEMPPPMFEPGTAPDDLPATLEAVIQRALAKRPEQRHASMSEFASDLANCLRAPAFAAAAIATRPIVRRASDQQSSAVTKPIHRTPGRSTRLQTLGPLSVLAAVAGALFGWPPPPAEGAEPRRFDDAPAPTCAPSYRRVPLAPPRAAVTPSVPEITEPPPPPSTTPVPVREKRLLRRKLAPASRPVARCMQAHGDPDATRVAVAFTITATGSVTAADAHDADAPFASRCIQDVLESLQFGPGPVTRIRHTFDLRSTEAP